MYALLPTDRPIQGIEIGLWEGVNAVRLLTKFPNLHLTGIDPFEGYDDWHGHIPADSMHQREGITMRALEPFADRFTHIKRYSDAALELLPDGAFDFVYIDGDHSHKWASHDITNYWTLVKFSTLFGWWWYAILASSFMALRYTKNRFAVPRWV